MPKSTEEGSGGGVGTGTQVVILSKVARAGLIKKVTTE